MGWDHKWSYIQRTINLIISTHNTKHGNYYFFDLEDHENLKNPQCHKFQNSSRQEHNDTSLYVISDNFHSSSIWNLLTFRRRTLNFYFLHLDILSWDVHLTFSMLHLLDLRRLRQSEPIWLCSDWRWPGRLPGQIHTKARCSLNCWNSLCCWQRHLQFRAIPKQLRIPREPTVTSFNSLGESQSRH